MISTVFIGHVPATDNVKNKARAQDDASEIQWVELSTLYNESLAFDHRYPLTL